MLARTELQATTPVPTEPAIERIQQLLASAGAPGTFATRRTARSDEIALDVVGVGAVPLPLSRRTAEKLRAVAKPASYGLREKTLLDASVRDTWEVGKRQIMLDEGHWRRTLDRELPRIARDLGVPDGATMRAELHNLLLYEPGQFFATHQDSEKADGMIGSLVVLLPSDAKGGALVIEHHEERVSYRGSATQLVLVAFYADCRHEVQWLGTLPALAAPLCTCADGVGLARRILDLQWRWLGAWLDRWTKPPVSSSSRKSLADASYAIVALCAAAEIAGDLALQSTIVERLTSERDYPAAPALAVLREAASRGAAVIGLAPLHADWSRALTALVATPPRAPGDWAITTKLGCHCDLCVTLDRFLRAANQQQLEWRLAKERRAHVHGMITSHELPVTHVTRRTGSPFTLVLTKTRALLTRDADERKTWARDLEWLRDSAKAFSSPRPTPARRPTRR